MMLLVTALAASTIFISACEKRENLATVPAAEAPSSWKRFAAPPTPESPEVSCSSRNNARWRVFFDGSTVGAAPVNNIRERDPIPYEIDFSDVLGPTPSTSHERLSAFADKEWRLHYSREEAARIVKKVSDGWLIGFAAGENLGSLWWYPPEQGRGKKLFDRNVLAMVQGSQPDNMIVLSGLAHMQSDEGEALWVGRDTSGNWQIWKRAALKSAPHAHAAHPRGIVVAHSNGIDLVSSDQTIESLATVDHWMSKPFSVAVGPHGEIAVGRRFFVSLFRPITNGYSEEIYLPAQCANFRDNEVLCFCEGQ